RLEGRRACVLVATLGPRVVGCAALAERLVYCEGRPTRMLYASDLKVDAEFRGQGVANALVAAIRDQALRWARPGTLLLAPVLAGNRAMERRLDGPRGLPPLRRLATIRSVAIPALRRPGPDRSWRLAPATPGDVLEMLDLWSVVARHRQLASVYGSPDAFLRWVEAAPGLGLRAYPLARRSPGRPP